MKSVLISIQPKWCELIARGIKTIEARKTAPKIDIPFKCYIYCTKPKHIYEDIISAPTTKDTYLYAGGKVIGEFICDSIEILFNDSGNPINYMKDILPNILTKTAMTYNELAEYVGGRGKGKNIYGWHISDLKIYDKPKELNEFYNSRKCYACDFGDIPSACRYDDNCIVPVSITCPPQSWMYIEEQE